MTYRPTGKAAEPRGEFFAKAPHFGVRGEEFTFLLNGIDKRVGGSKAFGGNMSGNIP